MTLDGLLQRIPTVRGALVTLGSVLAFGAFARDRVHTQLVLPERVDSVQTQVDTLGDQLTRHMQQDVPAMRRQIDFLYCREIERAGETPQVPCLQLTK